MRTQSQVPNVVIIGADGFIGRPLALALAAARVKVTAYSRVRRFSREDRLARPLHTADLVFYLASSINPALGELHPEWAAADHRQFAGLLRQLAVLRSPPTVVLTSSGGTVYDPSVPPPYSEKSPTRATNLYGAAKLALEAELIACCDVIPGVILRLSNVYGPGQQSGKGQGVLAYWLRAAAHGGALHAIGDPHDTRDYVYIDDVVTCMCLLYQAAGRRPGLLGSESLVLNVGSGAGTSLAELMGIVQDAVGRDLPVAWRPARRLDRPHMWLDCGSAERILGWRPRTCLADGISAMWHDLATDGGPRQGAQLGPLPLLDSA